MAYASISGRARTSSRNPQAFAVCDRCGIWNNHCDLQWQFDWRGANLQNLRILVCRPCLDRPQMQLKAFSPPADPVPIMNPRTEAFIADESNYRVVSGSNTVNARTGIPVPGGATRITQNDNNRVVQQTGEPSGGLNTQPGTDPTVPDDAGGNDPGLPYENTSVPETGPLYGEGS